MDGAERVLVPGDLEAAARRDREVNGVPVPGVVLAELDELALQLRIEPLARLERGSETPTTDRAVRD